MPTLSRPEDPLPLAGRWLEDAAARVPKNPWAMALATVSPEGRPSLRYVLLKSLSTSQGYAVFYTNYGSRKAAELQANARAAAQCGRSTMCTLPVGVSRSPARVGPRAIISVAYWSMYDQCSSSNSSRSATEPGRSRW